MLLMIVTRNLAGILMQKFNYQENKNIMRIEPIDYISYKQEKGN